MKKLVRSINNLFVTTILIIFYLFIIGITSLLKRIFTLKKKKNNSTYWIDNEKIQFDLNDFGSSY